MIQDLSDKPEPAADRPNVWKLCRAAIGTTHASMAASDDFQEKVITHAAFSVEGVAMEHAVKVSTIPVEIEFPQNLQHKIRFNGAQQQLVFQGFMCKSEYDQLLRLNQDVNYQNAVTQLFQLSTISNSPQLRRLGRMLATLTIACFVLAAFVWWLLLYKLPT